MKRKANDPRQLAMTSVLLALLALVSVTAATLAWLTIADSTRVRSMRMEITSGMNLRFDLDAHDSFEEYVRTLSFAEIAQRISQEKGFDPTKKPLVPVTTSDCEHFTLEKGEEAKEEYYLEFTLHFMATQDMIVHLSSANSENGNDGTRVESKTKNLPSAMRLSFTAEETSIYNPGMGDETEDGPGGKLFGLPDGNAMAYHDGNALFELKKNVDKPVVVRIWLEGTDKACTDDLRKAEYSIQLRFVGTDKEGNILETGRKTNVQKTMK